MVIIEAMSCGLPCVAFDCPEGPRDIITNSKDGFVIENRDTEVLFNKVDELITNPEMLKTFSNNAAKASKLYSIENISEIWIDFFNKIKK
jgi:glycosyltransferase involved in cell wall biosynthesis